MNKSASIFNALPIPWPLLSEYGVYLIVTGTSTGHDGGCFRISDACAIPFCRICGFRAAALLSARAGRYAHQ